MQKRTIRDIRIYEVEVPDGKTDEEIIEEFNVGDLEGPEVDGHIELEED